jgi:hypothetical protein
MLVLLAVLAVAACGGTVCWGLWYTPDFYIAAITPLDPQVRHQQARQFVQVTMQLFDDIRNEDRWAEEFTEDQVNSWLAEELHQKFGEWVPEGVQQPRVKFEQDSLQLGFQFEHGRWKGVLCAQIRPWVADANQLAIEIQSVRAGLFPLPIDDLFDDLLADLREHGWRVEVRQTARGDVLVVDLSRRDGSDRQPVLEAINLKPGLLRISGLRKQPAADDTATSLRFEQTQLFQVVKSISQR